MKCFAHALAGLIVLIALPSPADSIRIDNQVYRDVYVTESERLYYILLPDSGKARSVAKDDSRVGQVDILEDEDARDALLARYRETREANRQRASIRVRIETVPDRDAFDRVDTPDVPQDGADRVLSYSDGGVPILRLKGDAKARPPIQFSANGVGRGGMRQGALGGGVTTFGSAQGPSAGGGRGGTGGGRGAGAGGGGAGGGGGDGLQTGTSGFTNISELFGTIDDHDVGETPNPIALRAN